MRKLARMFILAAALLGIAVLSGIDMFSSDNVVLAKSGDPAVVYHLKAQYNSQGQLTGCKGSGSDCDVIVYKAFGEVHKLYISADGQTLLK
jgi:hypothetical protein